MTFKEYQKLAQRTSSTKRRQDKLLNGLLGLGGESGEAIDILKKHLYQGHELDEEKLKDECSDVLWYLAEVAEGLDMNLGDIAQHNIYKLQNRYPEGFESERSVNRE